MKWNKDWDKNWNGIEFIKNEEHEGLSEVEVEHTKRIIADEDLPPQMRELLMKSAQQIEQNVQQIEQEKNGEELRQLEYRIQNAWLYSSLGWSCLNAETRKGNEWVEKDDKKLSEDKEKAVNYFLEAYKRGDLSAAIGMALVCYSRLGSSLSKQYKLLTKFHEYYIIHSFSPMYIMKDEEECKEWLMSAINRNTDDVYKLYKPLMETSLWKQWFKTNVVFSRVEAMYLMGCMCADRISLNAEDRRQVVYWLEKAAEGGHIQSLEGLGYMYETRESPLLMSSFSKWVQKKDKDKAAQYYQQALALDNTADKSIATTARVRLATIDDKCFITTAVCSSFGKPDNCYELSMFRSFRDNWLVKEADGKELIDKYYHIAPAIVSKINERNDSRNIYLDIWETYLQPCLLLLEHEKYKECKEQYVNMIYNLQSKYR